ncbi:class A beta-lactamase [Lichenicola cladoniae]|nr:class A beta-lactamase [Lichenicola cladoniae]
MSIPTSLAFLGAYRVEARADPLSEIEARHGGRLGVFAIDTDTGRTLTHRADERFTMCSTFKGLLAGQIMSRVDAGHESLARLVHFNAHDLSTAGYPDFLCPVTAAHVSQGALTVATLCQASVAVSDNLAAILLMQSVGGPPGFNRFLRSLGDGITRSDRYEPGSNSYDGLLDTTTPRAIIGSARKLLLGDVLKPSSRELLTSWMIDSTPGLRRLRASFPPNWVTGDKAGTYGPDETNDYAITWPPGRRPVLIAAYYNAPGMDLDLREAVLREVGTVVAALVGESSVTPPASLYSRT